MRVIRDFRSARVAQALLPVRFSTCPVHRAVAAIAKPAQAGVPVLRALHGRKLSPGNKCSNAIALGDWQQQMRWMIGTVVHGYSRRGAAGNMADSDQLKIVLRGVVVGALDFDSDALTGLEQDAVRSNFNIEFINLVGLKRFSPGMQMNRLPGRRCSGIQLSLRSAEPAARQQ